MYAGEHREHRYRRNIIVDDERIDHHRSYNRGQRSTAGITDYCRSTGEQAHERIPE